MKKFLKYSLFLIVIFSITFLLLEIGTRTFQKITRKIPFSKSASDYHDQLLGWTGKKIFGNPQTNRKKILVIGDSYTNGVGADETQMYYRVVAKALDAELFVYGGSGYGSLQEYLVIDKYIDEIKPDLIIVQACSNDFINNSYELEKGSYSNNNLMVRPYLIKDKIKYYYPRFLGGFRTFLIGHSRVLYMTFNGIDRMFAQLAQQGKIKGIEHKIQDKELDFKPFARSKETTYKIFEKMKIRAGSTPLIVTASTLNEPFHSHFADIFQKLNIFYITEPIKVINEMKSKGVQLSLAKVGHWNEQGHQIYGTILLQEIVKLMQAANK